MLISGVIMMGLCCSPCFCMSSSLSEWRRRVSRRGCSHCVLLQEYRGLKEGWRGGGGGCMEELALLPCERSSIVPGTFQWLPRGPCSYPSPHHTVFNPQRKCAQKKKKKHTQGMHCPLLNTPSCIFLFHSSLMFFFFYRGKHGLSLSLARPGFLFISPHHAAKIV